MINDIRLQNFRSYKEDSFEFSPEVNIIVGPNASGKTSLLEAILVSSSGSSYRGLDHELIKFNEPWSRLEAHSDNTERIVKIERTLAGKVNKTFIINTQKFTRLSLPKTIPVVIFEPTHMSLINGSPELRRSLIDEILEKTIVGYKQLRQNYRRALAQRNRLLKRADLISPESVFVWNVRLSELGGRIFKERQSIIETFQAKIGPKYEAISKTSDRVEVFYKTSCDTSNYETSLLKNLENNLATDRARGFTSYGPHRDDIIFLINGYPASDTASRGETRSIILVLKIIETEIIEAYRNEKPVFLFDDVFSELDGTRRILLTNILEGYQTFITTTEADMVVQRLTETTTIIPTKGNPQL
jgi:DNA replication and repair protein RecF